MSGDAALGVFTGGMLLIFVECNRPGLVLPGSAGLLLASFGAYQLSSLPVPPAALWFAGGGLLAMVAGWWRQFRGLPGTLGSMVLCAGFLDLSLESKGELTAWWAAGCGLLLGGLGSFLLFIAGRARRSKRTVRHAGGHGTPGVREHWGVD